MLNTPPDPYTYNLLLRFALPSLRNGTKLSEASSRLCECELEVLNDEVVDIRNQNPLEVNQQVVPALFVFVPGLHGPKG